MRWGRRQRVVVGACRRGSRVWWAGGKKTVVAGMEGQDDATTETSSHSSRANCRVEKRRKGGEFGVCPGTGRRRGAARDTGAERREQCGTRDDARKTNKSVEGEKKRKQDCGAGQAVAEMCGLLRGGGEGQSSANRVVIFRVRKGKNKQKEGQLGSGLAVGRAGGGRSR